MNNGAETAEGEQQRRSEEEQHVDLLLSRLDVKSIGRSRVVEVAFTDENPVLAAEVANSLADLYLVTRFEYRLQNARRASEWLASHVQQLRADVEHTETTVENYRREHDLLQGERITLLNQQATDLNTKLMDASVDRAAAEAELAQARRVIGKGNDVASLGQVLKSGLIEKLREEEVSLERSEAEMSQRYGPLYPKMGELAAAKQRFKEKVQVEVNKIISSLESQVEVARVREAALKNKLEGLKEQVGQANAASVPLHTLERDADASRLLLDKFMTSFMEVSAQQDVHSQAPEAAVISKAAIPEHPSFPQKGLMIFLASIGGLVISVPLVFIAETFSSAYVSAQEVERDTGLPVLAHVPKMRRRNINEGGLATHVLSQPESVYTESIRSLCARFLIFSSDCVPHSAAFISSEVGEGKTTIILSVARMLAESGRKVVVVDADLRRGKVADMLQLSRKPGLSELIAEDVKLQEVIQQDPQSAADVIVNGGHASGTADMLASEAFSSTLQELEGRYDLVLIDGPPFLALSSASVLASKVDTTVVIVAWGATRREVFRYTVEQIQTMSPRVAGVVLSKVDLRKNAKYEHGDSRVYGGDGRKYYTPAA